MFGRLYRKRLCSIYAQTVFYCLWPPRLSLYLSLSLSLAKASFKLIGHSDVHRANYFKPRKRGFQFSFDLWIQKKSIQSRPHLVKSNRFKNIPTN